MQTLKTKALKKQQICGGLNLGCKLGGNVCHSMQILNQLLFHVFAENT